MKQLLPLFLFLLPCLAWAQYPSNGNQKITLGEQTTADGLIYRGVLADTGIITPSSDTSAYIILDTVNNRFFHYKRNTNVWSIAGGSDTSLIAYVNTYGAQTVNGEKTFNTGILSGISTSTTPPIIIRGGSGGTNMFELRRTAGVTATYAFSIAGGYLNFKDVTNNTVLLTLGISGVNPDINLGLDETTGSSLPGTTSILRAANSGTTADLTGGSLFIRSGRGTGSGTLSDITFQTADLQSSGTARQLFSAKMVIKGSGNVGIGQSTPTAVLHLKAGTATASTAPLKFTSGTNLTTAEAGAMEFNGTNLFFSPSTTRHTVNHGLTGSATLNFPSTNAQSSADDTIAVTGAAVGDVVSLGVPNAAVNANTSYSAWVSAAGTVTVRFNNYSSGTVDPASALFKVFVTK
jgi:hypothetical protein